MSYLELLKLAAPETIVVLTALAVLAVDLTSMRGLEMRTRFVVGGLLTCVGCIAAILWMLVMPAHANALEGMLVVDPLTQLVKIALLVLTIFTVLISIESNFTAHVGEYLALILFATVGMMFLVSAEDILMIFVSLELTSLSLYILTAFNKRDIKSAEAALTHDFAYYLLGVGIAHSHREFGPGGKIPSQLMVATMSVAQSALAGILRAEMPLEAALDASVAWNKLLLIHLNVFLIGYSLPES